MTEERTPKTAKRPRRAPRGIRRRHVLLGAGAAAGALAVTRVLGLHHLGDFPTLGSPAETAKPTSLDWISPLERPEAQVGHLLRRATFGATPAEYELSVSDGFKKTVDRLLETFPAEPPALTGGDEATREKPPNPLNVPNWWLGWEPRAPTPFAADM